MMLKNKPNNIRFTPKVEQSKVLALILFLLWAFGCAHYNSDAMHAKENSHSSSGLTSLTLKGIESTAEGLQITLAGSQPFSYSLSNHDRPLRLSVDIPQAHIGQSVDRIVDQGGVKAIRLSPVSGQQALARLELQLQDGAVYSVAKEQELLLVNVRHSRQITPSLESFQQEAARSREQTPPSPPISSQPSSSKEYRVGSGDVLAISVYDEPDLTRKVLVSASGLISFPFIGSVEVSGLTTAEITKRLENALSPRFLLYPQIFVEVDKFDSKKVFIVGAVDQPGTFTLRGETTLLEILSQIKNLSHSSTMMIFRRAPGLSAHGDSSDSTMRALRVDLDRLLRQGDMSLNMVLQPDDVLYLPKPDAVFVFGKVRKEGPVPVPDGGMSLVEAINQAGGFAEFAAPGRTRVLRMVNGQERVIRVNMNALIRGDLGQDIKLQANDVVIVPETIF